MAEANKTPDAGQVEAAVAPAAPAQFRVVHGAVAGVKKNKKGEPVEHDFYTRRIVTDADLDGQAGQYLVLGAIEPIEPLE